MLSSETPLISNAFRTFMTEAPSTRRHGLRRFRACRARARPDDKTGALAYLAVIAALRLESGVPFHVQAAKKAGASREEVISAVLVGLPAAGNAVTACLPTALNAFDAE